MQLSKHLAKHLRELHFGGNWTGSNFKDALAGVDWKQATTSIYSLNTIALLVFHSNYYIAAVLKVLQGEPLHAGDKFSFDCPVIRSEQDWEALVAKNFADVETFCGILEQLPDEDMWENFEDGKYGNLYRNIQGILEHSHYHLGQIVVIKKPLLQVAGQ